MGVGAFESSDNEETFSFLFHGLKHTEKFLDALKLGNFCVFRESFLILERKEAFHTSYPKLVMKNSKVAKFG